MVPELIPVNQVRIGGAPTNGVNSRDIHEYVGSKQDYSTWIKKRLEQLGAVENEDYLTLHKKMERQLLIDYIVTADIAKHLGMMERNDRGKEIRDYFIAMEKRAHLVFDPTDPIAVLDYAKTIALENKSLLQKIEDDRPKVSYAEAVVGSINPISLRDWINTLKSDEGLVAKERAVINFLINKKLIYRHTDGKLKPYADYSGKYFSLIPITSATPKGNREFTQLKVTGLGQLEVGNMVLEHFGQEVQS